MGIGGFNVRIKVGAFQILRSPRVIIESKRRAIMGRSIIEVPDPTGEIRQSLSTGDSVTIMMRYHCSENSTLLEQTWQGTLSTVATHSDILIITALGLEKSLMDTIITESFYNEPVNIVAKRLLENTGYSVSTIDIGDYVLPHQVFSAMTVSRAIKNLFMSMSRSFDVDMSSYALWLDSNAMWHLEDNDNTDESGIFCIETAQNMISHKPPESDGEMGECVCVLLPSLSHSRLIKIRDTVRQVVLTVRAQEVLHSMIGGVNRTSILYGKNEGWG